MVEVAAFYCFAPLADPEGLRAPLLSLCRAEGVRGSVLLAAEGVNGTIAGPGPGVAAVVEHLRGWPGCGGMEVKTSRAAAMPFGRMKVKLKAEIVTMGQPGVDPRGAVGRYVAPQDWNDLIRAPDVVVIDTRNDYEVRLGSFEGALNPGTARFRDFPAWWEANRARIGNRRVAMFCTGGIRCEKATSWLVGQGVEEVFHLQGGILKYLEEVPEGRSLWQGECFVFDERVAVGHGLAEGEARLCRACRGPVTQADLAHPDYEPGVSCPACRARFDETDRARFRERERQIRIAQARGSRHLGGEQAPAGMAPAGTVPGLGKPGTAGDGRRSAAPRDGSAMPRGPRA